MQEAGAEGVEAAGNGDNEEASSKLGEVTADAAEAVEVAKEKAKDEAAE